METSLKLLLVVLIEKNAVPNSMGQCDIVQFVIEALIDFIIMYFLCIQK